jgi:hypothetical protein
MTLQTNGQQENNIFLPEEGGHKKTQTRSYCKSSASVDLY